MKYTEKNLKETFDVRIILKNYQIYVSEVVYSKLSSNCL